MGDRREGTASWVEPSESRSDLQPGGRCCRRRGSARRPPPPGSRVPVLLQLEKKVPAPPGAPLPPGEETLPPLHSSAGSSPRPSPASELPLFPLSPPLFFFRSSGRVPGGSRHVVPGQEEHPPHHGKRSLAVSPRLCYSGRGTALSGRAESAGGGGERSSGGAGSGATPSFRSSALGSFSFHSFDFISFLHRIRLI